MNGIESSIEAWILEYLLNSLWQVPLIFAVAWLLNRTVRLGSVEIEHRIWVTAILLQTLVPALSAHSFRWLGDLALLLRQRALPGSGEVTVAISPGAGLGNLSLASGLSATIATCYALALVYFAARLAWGVSATFATQREVRPLPLPDGPALCWKSCCRAIGVRNAQVAISKRIAGPMTMGLLNGIVLLPSDMIERSSEEDLRAVFSHELAHIRRRDFAKNLLYELLALPVTYHPVCWLTRACLVESRETICDEIAATLGSGRENYARSLLRLASLLVQPNSSFAPHAIGIFDANTLERRIMKLTFAPTEIRGLRRVATLALCLTCGLGTCASAMALHAGVSLPQADNPGNSGDTNKTSAQVSAGVMAGLVLSKVTPKYPQAAKEARIHGAVVLKAIIGKDGKVDNLQVLSGPRELVPSALDAVRQWIYKPYLLNGDPTEVETTITVTYTLGK